MLNYTNSLEGHVPPAESAALMVAEEKSCPDRTCKPYIYLSSKVSIAPPRRLSDAIRWLWEQEQLLIFQSLLIISFPSYFIFSLFYALIGTNKIGQSSFFFLKHLPSLSKWQFRCQWLMEHFVCTPVYRRESIKKYIYESVKLTRSQTEIVHEASNFCT